MKEPQKVKCDRCRRIRNLFQYTFFDTPKIIKQVKYNPMGNPKFTVEDKQIDESRGLCEECAVEINKKKYDETQ